MKRLIGIAVIFTLVTASAFAQVQVSGQIRAGGDLVIIDSEDDSDPRTARLGESARVDFRVGNDREAGDVGGLIRLQANGGFSRAFAWWRPHNMVRLQFGQNSDGDWGMARINGWSFLNGDAMDLGVARRTQMRHAHAVGFYQGLGMQAILLSVFPIDGLTVNFGLPLANQGGGDGSFAWTNNNPNDNNPNLPAFWVFDGGINWSRADDAWKRVHAQAVYNINNIGIVSLSYAGGRGTTTVNNELVGGRNLVRNDLNAEGGVFYLSFFSGGTFVDGLDLNFGLSYEIPVVFEPAANTTVTVQDPMEIGLGVRYTAGDLGVSFRTAVSFLGSVKTEAGGTTTDATVPVMLGFNLLPNYAIGSMRVFLNLGLDLEMYDGETKDIQQRKGTAIQWIVNPYVRIPVGGLQFFAGFSVEGYTDDNRQDPNDSAVVFRMPIGVVFSL